MLPNKEGQKIPNTVFTVVQNGAVCQLSSDRLFLGKTVVLFSLPGAFTPTCSSAHVPRYNELAPTFHENGIDEIYCVSVNDSFVMSAWQNEQEANQLTFLPDGNGTFTHAMGMLVDKSSLGFGKRSWRYSMLVKDGVIEKMFIEPEVEGDPYNVSDADTMLDYINPKAIKPTDIVLFTKKGCPHCLRAKQLLKEKDLSFEEIELNKQITLRSLRAVSGMATTPQIFIAGNWIGGADELETHFKAQL